MKNHLLKPQFCITLLILCSCQIQSFAQTKLATIRLTEILDAMPERKQIDETIQQLSVEQANKIKDREKAFQKNIQDFNESFQNMNEQQRKSYEDRLRNEEEALRKLQENVNQMLSDKLKALNKPLLTKIKQTVSEIAEKEGYSHVLNNQEGYGGFLYAVEKDDLTAKVKAKLGLK